MALGPQNLLHCHGFEEKHKEKTVHKGQDVHPYPAKLRVNIENSRGGFVESEDFNCDQYLDDFVRNEVEAIDCK